MVWNIDLRITTGWVRLHKKNIEGEKKVEVGILHITHIEGINGKTETCKHVQRMGTEVGRKSVEYNFKKEQVGCI